MLQLRPIVVAGQTEVCEASGRAEEVGNKRRVDVKNPESWKRRSRKYMLVLELVATESEMQRLERCLRLQEDEEGLVITRTVT